MSAQHTPGSWKAHFEEAYFVTGPDLGRVAMMMNLKGAHGLGGRRSGGESAANARLIAAAPELLEALESEYAWLADIRNSWPGRHGAEGQARLIRLREVISKATGREPREVQDDFSTRLAREEAATPREGSLD
jgi:hypothetical protein